MIIDLNAPHVVLTRNIGKLRPLALFEVPVSVDVLDEEGNVTGQRDPVLDDVIWKDEVQTKPDQTEYNNHLAQAAVLELEDGVVAAVQKRLDDFAKTRGYDSILSAATYATSSITKFRNEGQYAVDARDAHWAACYQILNDVLGGIRPMPTMEEVLAELPTLTWPT